MDEPHPGKDFFAPAPLPSIWIGESVYCVAERPIFSSEVIQGSDAELKQLVLLYCQREWSESPLPVDMVSADFYPERPRRLQRIDSAGQAAGLMCSRRDTHIHSCRH
ncbi:hypothetical protein Tco_0008015 [Tanacetum coccineum]